MVEFGIAERPKFMNGMWYLAGRCVTDVHVGDRFTKFFPIRRVGEPGPENMNYVRSEAVPIDMTVVEIFAYGKLIESWSAGLTARLTLKGEGDNLGDFGSLCGEELGSE